MTDKVRWSPSERVDIPDFRNATADFPVADNRRHVRELLGIVNSVISGFEVTPSGPPDAIVTVTRGSALVGENVNGSPVLGALLSEGAASKTIDFTGEIGAPTTYTLYVRFSFALGTAGNRVFWDTASNGEVVRSVNTRLKAEWELTFATVSPGPEWLPIADVSWDSGAGVITAGDITDKRRFFYEGEVSSGYAQEWGGGPNDRDTDRAQWGVTDARTWAQALRRQITDILGVGNGWYDAVPVSLATIAAALDLPATKTVFFPWSGDQVVNWGAVGMAGPLGGNVYDQWPARTAPVANWEPATPIGWTLALPPSNYAMLQPKLPIGATIENVGLRVLDQNKALSPNGVGFEVLATVAKIGVGGTAPTASRVVHGTFTNGGYVADRILSDRLANSFIVPSASHPIAADEAVTLWASAYTFGGGGGGDAIVAGFLVELGFGKVSDLAV